jgi:hypothetical protein
MIENIEDRPSNSDRLPKQHKELAMANQELKRAGGKPGSVSPMEALNRSELSDSPTTLSVAGRGRMTAYPISFATATTGLRKSFDQNIPMDDQHQSLDESYPSEVFLG